MKQSGSLCVVPESIIFNDIQPGCSTSKDLYVHNIGKKPIRVHFSIPINSNFAFMGNTSTMLAPGLEMKCSVRYFASKNESIPSTNLTIQCDDGKINLPIIAQLPSPVIEFETNKIDFGITSPGIKLTKQIKITNSGTKECSISFTTNEANVSITPANLTILPKDEEFITIIFTPKSIGDYHFEIIPKMKPQTLPPILVTTKVINQEVVLLYKNEEVSELNFGHIYFSQRKILRVTIKNKSASTRSYIIMPPHDPSNPIASKSPSTLNDPAVIFTAVPCEGIIKPFQQTTISFIFGPPYGNSTEKMFSHISMLKIIETKQTHDFQLTGIGMLPDFSIDQVDFNFGDQLVRTKQSQSFFIENHSPILPLSYEIKDVAQYNFVPRSSTVNANSKQEIQVIFFPKNLGEFALTTTIDISKGLAKRRLNLTGTSISQPTKKFKRIPIYETDETAAFNVQHPTNKYGLTLEEIEKKNALRETFDQYIQSNSQTKHNSNNKLNKNQKLNDNDQLNQNDKTNYKNNQDQINLNQNEKMITLNQGNQINSNQINKLNSSNNTYKSDNSKSSVNKNERILDIKKKRFKPKPTTSPEMEECNRILSPAQQTQIIASSQSVNFGTISVYSNETRQFQITNKLNQHILISFNYCAELVKSNPISQVIPPQQTAEFDFVFCTEKQEKNFLKPIFFLVNNHHEFSINILATIKNIDIELSRNEINFSFDEVSLSKSELVTIFNRSNAVVHFHWSNFNDIFSVASEIGTIQPKSSTTIEIKYSPGILQHSELIALLNIAGGTTKELKLIGDMGKPRVSFVNSKIDLGVIPINYTKTSDVKMKNTSSNKAIFYIENKYENLEISPLIGEINPGEVKNLTLTAFFKKEIEYQTKIEVTVLGYSKLNLFVKAKSEYPSIEISNEPLNFESLFIGLSAQKTLLVKNTGNIPCQLAIDLSKYSDFHLSTKLTLNNSIDLTEKFSVYFLRINAKSSIEINLIYQPTKIGQFKFDLPISLIEPKMKFDCVEFKNSCVEARSIHSPLLPSVSEIDFGLSSVIEKPNPNQCFQTRQFMIKNQSKLPINFHFKNSSEIFNVRPKQGRIDFSSEMSIIIDFKPLKAVPYHFTLPLYANLDEGETLITEIELTGVGSSRKFRTSTDSICLPIVPIGVKIERTIEVINTSYCLTELKASIPLNEKSFPIELHWPKGHKFDYTTLKLPLTIKFESNCTLSFNTTVAITDKEGHSFTFNLSGGCDNSIFSLYQFISYNKFYLNTDKNGTIKASISPTQNSLEHNAISNESINKNSMKYDENDYSITNDFLSDVMSNVDSSLIRSINNSKMNDFLLHYLNSIVYTNTIIQNFPEDFVNNGIELLNEMISNLTEKKTNLDTYTEIIQYLKSQGAILTNIKPEFLMSKTDFLNATKQNLIKKLLGIDYLNAPSIDSFDNELLSPFLNSQSFSRKLNTELKQQEQLFDELSNQSWICVVLQILKLFLINKLKIDLFNTKGVNEALNALNEDIEIEQVNHSNTNSQNELNLVDNRNLSKIEFNRSKSYQSSNSENVQTKIEKEEKIPKVNKKVKINRSTRSFMLSNFYSPIESMLLKWVSILISSISKEAVELIDFCQLNQISMFLQIFEANIKRKLNDYNDILDFLKEINAGYFPTSDELLNGNDCMYCLIIQFLYETLPHCIPSLSLNFNQNLLTKKIQSIEITNPSKFNLTYQGQLKGSSNFSMITDKIELKGNETKKFEIEYFARSHNSEKATLILIPNKPNLCELPQTARNSTTPKKKLAKAPNSARPKSNLTKPKNESNLFNISTELDIKSSLSNSIHSNQKINSNSNEKLNSKDKHNSNETSMNDTKSILNISNLSSLSTINNSITKSANTFASTIVVSLTSTIQIKSPYKSINIEGDLYEVTKFSVDIDNPVQLNGEFELFTRYFPIEDENGRIISKTKPTKQLIQFLNDPTAQPSYLTATSKFTSIVEKHQPFLIQTKSVEFLNSNSISLDIEFIPIQLGKYRFLILFYNEHLGEFVYEINGLANLPKPIENTQKVKIEAEQSKMTQIRFSIYNQKLFYALSYSICKQISLKMNVSELKFRDLLNFNIREIQSEFKKVFVQVKYTVKTSSQYFTYKLNRSKLTYPSITSTQTHSKNSRTNSEVNWNSNSNSSSLIKNSSKNYSNSNYSSIKNSSQKSSIKNGIDLNNLNDDDFVASKEEMELPIEFQPDKPGDYKCHVLLSSDYDIRLFILNGLSLMPTKRILIEMQTTCGQQIIQNLPFNNPSNSIWHYKVSLKGDGQFKVNDRFDIQPQSTFQLPVTFLSQDKGIFNCLLDITNYSKEITVLYNISCIVSNSKAEEIIELKGRAKQPIEYSFPVKKFIERGIVDVSTDLTILQFNPKLNINDEFCFTANSMVSGQTSGQITFHDPITFRSIWYILNIEFDRPLPEEILNIKTIARQSATIQIPVHNPSSSEKVVFDVSKSDDDLFGSEKLELGPNETVIYELIYSPLISIQRTSFVSFINELYGEFIYQLNLESENSDMSIISPLTAPIGQFALTTIKIENPVNKKVLFKIENDNPLNFLVLSNAIFSMNENEVKNIQIKYIPSTIGKIENTVVKFTSRDAGEWSYKLSGIGKPPQPMSPVIFNSVLNESVSKPIVFPNPFPFLSKFEITLNSEGFELLNHKRIFSLQNYNDEHSIAISFHPKISKQFNGNLIIKSLNSIQVNWTYPLIGIVLNEKFKENELRGFANSEIIQQFELPLVAESDIRPISDYTIDIQYEDKYDFLVKYFELKKLKIIEKNNSPVLIVEAKFTPRRPMTTQIFLFITNPLKQIWNFTIAVDIKPSEPVQSILIESNLQQITKTKIKLHKMFKEKVAYKAYFVNGSCHDFSLDKQQGFIEPSIEEERELPFDIIFQPKIYGKVFKGLLVMDTLEEQFLFEVEGKIPDYKKPVIKSATIDTSMPMSARIEKKRNIIKDNIESARKPNVRVKQVPRKEWR